MTPVETWTFLGLLFAVVGLGTWVALQRIRIAELRREADVLFAELLRPRFVDWASLYLLDEEEAA